MAEPSPYFIFVNKRPDGCPEFQRNENGSYIVHSNEVFCRVFANGAICANDNKFDSAGSVRTHISSNHPEVNLEASSKGRPNNAAKEAATADLAHVVKCVLEHRSHGRRGKPQSSKEAGSISTPETPTKSPIKRKTNGSESASKKSRKSETKSEQNEQATAVKKELREMGMKFEI